MRGRLAILLAVLVAALFTSAAPAAAAQRLETIAAPSAGNVDPATVAFNGSHTELRANVLLPDGYDEGTGEWPVLFLLHGVGDAYDTWARPDRGDIQRTAAGLGAIVVMPEAARGFYTNWWNGGLRGSPGWERYHLDELIPLIEERYRVRPGRRWHAIAGLSMGGMGSTYLGSQAPGYFGSIASFSGFVQHQRPHTELGLRLVGGVEYNDIFGPLNGFYASGHNPTKLTDNLRHTRLFVTSGSGVSDPRVESSPAARTAGGLVEVELRTQAEELVLAARESGVEVRHDRPVFGVHDWPYWRENLREAIAWDLFAEVEEAPAEWTYDTVASSGRMWDLGYSFAAPPPELARFERSGERLSGSGSGTVTITTAAGCAFTAELPFERRLPTACREASFAGRVPPGVKPRPRLGRRTSGE